MTEQKWLTNTNPLAMLSWLRGTGVYVGFDNWRKPVSDRKLRLLACACCRQVWHLLTNDSHRKAVEVAERYADGDATEGEILSVLDVSGNYTYLGEACCVGNAQVAAIDTINMTNGDIMPGGMTNGIQAAIIRDIFGNPWKSVRCPECHPEAVGLSKHWKPHPCNGCNGYGIQHSWLSWKDGTIFALAQAIYKERDFELMPMLADGLEEAGCTNEDVLRHCRGQERKICSRCEGDGKAHGADRPFEWNPSLDYMKCSVCKGTGMGIGWMPLRTSHVRGCWVLDLFLGKE